MEDSIPLADEIAQTLRGIIKVESLYRGCQIATPDFWPRCRRVDTDDGRKIIYVDGFAGCCRSNSWKVFADALEPGLSLWLGYAFSWDQWVEHAWCMLGDRVVESTFARLIYFGAELTAAEREIFCKRHGDKSLESRRYVSVITFVDGKRECVEPGHSRYAHTIGRERDRVTGALKEGLGR